MKKTFLVISLLLIFSAPFIINAAGIVPCTVNCSISNFFEMLLRIYTTILTVAVPLATLSLTVGGILILVSAGNPKIASTGKAMLWSGIIGLILTLGSRAIISTILEKIGAKIPL